MHHGIFHTGTSGWAYPEWKGGFYPATIRAADRLAYYASQFDALEVNNSFYRLPDTRILAGWATRVPDHFLFCIKMWRGVAHMGVNDDTAAHLQSFILSLKPLAGRMGPVLIQFHPGVTVNPAALEKFLILLEDKGEFAFEFRHSGWYRDDIISLLGQYRAGMVVHDMRGSLQDYPGDGAGFVYIRYHGTRRYAGSYSDDRLVQDADRIRKWMRHGKKVYAFFNNTMDGSGPRNAMTLRHNVIIQAAAL